MPMPELAPSLHGRKSQGEQELPVSQQGRSPEAPRPQLDSRLLLPALEPAFLQQVRTQQSPRPGRQLPRDCLAWREGEGYGRRGGSQLRVQEDVLPKSPLPGSSHGHHHHWT